MAAISVGERRAIDRGDAERRLETAPGIHRHAVEADEVRRPDEDDDVEGARAQQPVGVRRDRAPST